MKPHSRPPPAVPGVAGTSRIPTSPPPCTCGLSETGLWPGGGAIGILHGPVQ